MYTCPCCDGFFITQKWGAVKEHMSLCCPLVHTFFMKNQSELSGKMSNFLSPHCSLSWRKLEVYAKQHKKLRDNYGLKLFLTRRKIKEKAEQTEGVGWNIQDEKMGGGIYDCTAALTRLKGVDSSSLTMKLKQEFDKFQQSPYSIESAIGTRDDWIHWSLLLSQYPSRTSVIRIEYQKDIQAHLETLDKLGDDLEKGYQGSYDYVRALHCIFHDSFLRCHLPSPPLLNLELAMKTRHDYINYRSRMISFDGYKYLAFWLIGIVVTNPLVVSEEESLLPEILPIVHRQIYNVHYYENQNAQIHTLDKIGSQLEKLQEMGIDLEKQYKPTEALEIAKRFGGYEIFCILMDMVVTKVRIWSNKRTYIASARVSGYLDKVSKCNWEVIRDQFDFDLDRSMQEGVYLFPIFTGSYQFNHWHLAVIHKKKGFRRGWIIDTLSDNKIHREVETMRKMDKIFTNKRGKIKWQTISCLPQVENECCARTALSLFIFCECLSKGIEIQSCIEKISLLCGKSKEEVVQFSRQILSRMFSDEEDCRRIIISEFSEEISDERKPSKGNRRTKKRRMCAEKERAETDKLNGKAALFMSALAFVA